MYRNAKASKEFIPGGTSQSDFSVFVCKRLHKDFEVRGQLQFENWKAPVYKSGQENDIITSVKVTWFPPDNK